MNTSVRVPEDVAIEAGGVLELGPGAVVSAAPGKGLYVRGGQLIAKGTAERQVVFTSSSTTPQPGDWSGVIFDWADLPEASRVGGWPDSVLEQAVIEFAGRPWSGRGTDERAGGLSVQGYLGTRGQPAGTLILTSVEFRNNALRGMDVRTDAALSWKDLKFGHNQGVSARIDTPRVEHLGVSPTEAVELVGGVRQSTALPRISQPFVVVETLALGSSRSGGLTTLTIPPGAIVKFKAGTGLTVGGYFQGKLVAHGVTFTSAETKPALGDWNGLFFWVNSAADLDGDTIEYAGSDASPVVSFSPSARPHIAIRNSTFRKNAGPSIADSTSCAKWLDPALGNVSRLQPMCVRGK